MIEEVLEIDSGSDFSSQKNEALSLKDCFTRYSFQSIAFIGIILGLVLKYDNGSQMLIGFGTIIILSVLTSVARLGIHKYTGANRIYGFELHLNRAKKTKHWNTALQEMTWQESMRAWRVVQPTIYRTIYRSGNLSPEIFDRERFLQCSKDNTDASSELYFWFLPNEMTREVDGTYHSGGYLWKMMSILYLLGFLTLAAFLISVLQDSQAVVDALLNNNHKGSNSFNAVCTLYLLAFLVLPFALIYVFGNFHRLVKSGTKSDGRIASIIDWMIPRKPFVFLLCIIALSLFVFLISALYPLTAEGIRWVSEPLHQHAAIIKNLILWWMFLSCLLFLTLRFIRDGNQRILIENELLSIHSCAVIWHVVLWCHLAVMDEIRQEQQEMAHPDPYFHYHQKLAEFVAKNFGLHDTGRRNIIEIKEWIGNLSGQMFPNEN